MPITSHSRRNRLGAVLAPLALSAAIASPTTGSAAMYKCVDANGDTTYTQTRCPTADAAVESITPARRRNASRTCGIVRNFADETARAMRRGRSSSQVFDGHGGMDTLSPAPIGIVSYVYEFRGDPRPSAARITELAVARCRGGAFGDVGCAAFPSAFVARLGGCEGAQLPGGLDRLGTPRPMAQAMPASGASHAPGFPERPVTTTPVTADDARSTRCRVRVTREIERVNAGMREAHSVRGQDRLRDRRRALGRELSRC